MLGRLLLWARPGSRAGPVAAGVEGGTESSHGEGGASSGDRQRAVIAGVVVAVAGLVVAMAAVFAATRSSVQIAEIGTRGIHDEAVLSAAATTRNRAVQAFLILTATDVGIAAESELTQSISAVEGGVAELAVRVDRLTGQLSQPDQRERLQEAADDFAASVGNLVDEIEDANAAASAADLRIVDDEYRVLAEILAADRDLMVHDLELAQEDAGRIANAARFLVAFAIPLGAVVAFRRSVRRRQRQLALEQELARQREIAQTKDDFIADVSHELRTPLTSIYGFASTLLDEQVSSNPEMTTEFATLIALEADELSRMVDDLLTAARADNDGLTFREEKVSPHSEVKAILGPMEAMGLVVHSKVADDFIRADRLRLRQVLRNLLSNAQKHGQAPIAITGRVEGLRYVLAVTDCGPGVPAELESRLFERFIHEGRDSLLAGSVGLGLSIARLLVRQMGGNLTYRRFDGLTTFAVELPLWLDPEEQWAPLDQGRSLDRPVGSKSNGNSASEASMSGK